MRLTAWRANPRATRCRPAHQSSTRLFGSAYVCVCVLPQTIPAETILALDRHRQARGFIRTPAWPRRVAGEFGSAPGTGEAARERDIQPIFHELDRNVRQVFHVGFIPNGDISRAPNIRQGSSRESAGSQKGARGGCEISRVCVRGQSAATGSGSQTAKTQSFAQQRRDEYRGKRSGDEAAGKPQRHRGDAVRR